MTIEMIDKWVTSLRFNEIKNENKCLHWFLIDFLFCRLAETAVSSSPSVTWFLGNDISLGSQCGCHLKLFIECVWSTKVLTMPAYCIAANSNKSQATQSITMHEFPRNRPAVRRKWVKFVQFTETTELTFMLRLSHAHLSSEHFAECDFVNFMAEYQMGFASKRNL